MSNCRITTPIQAEFRPVELVIIHQQLDAILQRRLDSVDGNITPDTAIDVGVLHSVTDKVASILHTAGFDT